MKNIMIGVLSVVVVVLSVLYARQVTQNEQLQHGQNEVLPEIKNSGVSGGNKEVETLKNNLADKDREIKILRKRLADLRKSNAALRKKGVAKGDIQIQNQRTDIEGAPEMAGDNLKKLKSLLDMQHAGSSAPTLEDKYSVLFDEIQVSDSVKKKMLALLNKKSGLLMGHGDDIERQINDLLGDEKYAKYKKYEKELPVRLFIDDFASYLTEHGHALSDAQVSEFMKLDSSVVKDIPLSYGSVQFKVNPTGEDEKLGGVANNALDESITSFDEVDTKASDVLDADQKELFDNYLGDRFKAKEDAANLMGQILPSLNLPNKEKSTISISCQEEVSLPSE